MKPALFPAIKPIAERAGLIRMFDLLLQETLPSALIGRVRALNLRTGVLVLGVDHGSLATQARFQSNHWLTLLNKAAGQQRGLPQLVGIEIRISTDQPQRKNRRSGHPPDAETRQALLSLADMETSPELANALRRLAKIRYKGDRNRPTEDDRTDRPS